jgi:hypothetical protein
LNLAALATLVAASALVVSRLDPKPGINLARGVAVTISSSDGSFKSAAGAVDGDIWHVGFRTDLEESPWILLDLAAEQVVTRFVVYNCYDRYPYPAIRPDVELSRDAQEANERFDCRQENEIPLSIEISRDGRNFSEVARQVQRFEMWTLRIAAQRARFVRLRLLREQCLQLREIEVY